MSILPEIIFGALVDSIVSKPVLEYSGKGRVVGRCRGECYSNCDCYSKKIFPELLRCEYYSTARYAGSWSTAE